MFCTIKQKYVYYKNIEICSQLLWRNTVVPSGVVAKKYTNLAKLDIENFRYHGSVSDMGISLFMLPTGKKNV